MLPWHSLGRTDLNRYTGQKSLCVIKLTATYNCRQLPLTKILGSRHSAQSLSRYQLSYSSDIACLLWLHSCFHNSSSRIPILNQAKSIFYIYWMISMVNRRLQFFGSLFYDAFSVTWPYSVGNRAISEWRWIGKDLVESGRDPIFKVLSLHSIWGNEENHEKPQSG
jgi:hypothetical protein